MNSLGEIIDKLITYNIKIYMLEDIKRDPNASDKDIADATRKTNILNSQRNNAINEIDQLIFGKDYQGTIKMYGKNNGQT